MELGLALAFGSITFQAFSGCIKGYQLLTDARGMPKQYHHLRVRIKLEQYRLLDWAHVAQLDETDENLLISGSNRQILYDVLAEQERLLMRFGRYDDKYKKLHRPMLSDVSDDGGPIGIQPGEEPPAYELQDRIPQSETLLKKALGHVEGTKKYPARLRWAGFEKVKVEALVGRLKGLNDSMMDMLNSQQLSALESRQIQTDQQIVQLNSKIDQLLQIVRSGQSSALVPGITQVSITANIQNAPVQEMLQRHRLESPDRTDHGGNVVKDEKPLIITSTAPRGDKKAGSRHLAELAQFKALTTAIDTNALTDELSEELTLGKTKQEVMSVELRRDDIELLDFAGKGISSQTSRSEAIYHHTSTRNGSVVGPPPQHVWIEWKTYDPNPYTGQPDPKATERIAALAAILRENSLSVDRGFRAPGCLGYFQDAESADPPRSRFGLVLEKPIGLSADVQPTSLLQLLRSKDFPTPSLTARIKLAHTLAESLDRLHAVDLLHKGLRSDNILMFPLDAAVHSSRSQSPNGQSSSRVAGFDFSSPLISGFDYSRPAHSADLTEKAPENPAFDLYRHPKVHGSLGSHSHSISTSSSSIFPTSSSYPYPTTSAPPSLTSSITSAASSSGVSSPSSSTSSNAPTLMQTSSLQAGTPPMTGPTSHPLLTPSFRKAHDVYALGIVMLEILHWRPIDAILAIPDVSRARPTATIRVRQRLLFGDSQARRRKTDGSDGLGSEQGPLEWVGSWCGEVVEGVVRGCLEGLVQDDGDDGDDGGLAEGAKLGREFYGRVVEKLAGVRV